MKRCVCVVAIFSLTGCTFHLSEETKEEVAKRTAKEMKPQLDKIEEEQKKQAGEITELKKPKVELAPVAPPTSEKKTFPNIAKELTESYAEWMAKRKREDEAIEGLRKLLVPCPEPERKPATPASFSPGVPTSNEASAKKAVAPKRYIEGGRDYTALITGTWVSPKNKK